MTISTTKKLAGLTVAAGLIAALAGCGSAPEANPTGGTGGDVAADFLPCIVSDFGGFDDKSFNQSSHEGIQAAASTLGVDFKQAESAAANEYEGNVQAMVDQSCNLIVNVGFNLANATRDSAKANPDVHYVLLDSALSNEDFSPLTLDNVKPVLYNTHEAAFLAGYLAAAATETGVVGTYGGEPYPSVTIFMDGFADGVAHHNETKGTSVKVLGWDKAAQSGSFAGTFEDLNAGKTLTAGFIDQGADIILPVAGPLFQGSAQAIRDSGKDVAIVGVDSDLFETSPEFKDLYLTSILKKMKDAVETIVVDAAGGEFDATPYIGTLANEGVDIAPLHEWESKVDPAVLTEIDQLRQDIIDGTLKVTSPSAN